MSFIEISFEVLKCARMLLLATFDERADRNSHEGRGGQGNVVAAYMLTRAAFEDGGSLKPIRASVPRGAPVSAFVCISDQPIKRRCQIREPQYVIIQDPSLLQVPNICQEVRADGGILINSSKEVAPSRFPGTAHVTTIRRSCPVL